MPNHEYEGATLAANRRPDLQVRMFVDASGHVCGGEFLEDADFMQFMRNTRTPVDPADIAMPDGWTLHDDGSATKDVVVDGVTVAHLTTEDVQLPHSLTSLPQ